MRNGSLSPNPPRGSNWNSRCLCLTTCAQSWRESSRNWSTCWKAGRLKMTTHAKAEEHRTVYEGRIFRVDVDLVRLPTGGVVKREIIRHPGSVVIVPMPADTDIILVRQYRYAI